MATSQMSGVIQHLRRAVLLQEGAGPTDGQLLEGYLSRREEAALAALVRRHGPMVWNVCRRVLRNYHDAEDAFQATFLVLVRKAASIVPREMVANWLYGVAHQTALKARATAARRKGRERQVAEMAEPAVAEQDLWRNLQPLLDEEVSCLPDKYRVVIVLCDLEGKTRKEAARQLGCPEGTVAGRLSRARAMLAKRLARRGLMLSGGVLAAVLAQGSASACVPASVLCSTIKAASLFAAGQVAATSVLSVKVAVLTEGVLKSMFLTKLKTMAAVLVAVTVLGGGVGLLAHRTLAAEQGDKPKAEAKEKSEANSDKKEEKASSDAENLKGEWQATSAEADGKQLGADKIKVWKLVFAGDKVKGMTKGDEVPFKLDPKKKPKEIDLMEDGEMTLKGIYELDGDALKVCWLEDKTKRPTDFDSSRGILAVFERKKE